MSLARHLLLSAVLLGVACKRGSEEKPLPAAPPEVPLPSAANRGRVVPIVRSIGDVKTPAEAFWKREKIESLQTKEEWDGGPVPADQMPITDSFVGDLTIRYAIDGERLMTDVAPSMLGELGLKREELLEVGIKNLHRLYPDAEITRHPGFGMISRSGDLESSWMLDRAFWAEEAKKVEGDLVASISARDIMAWADTAHPEMVAHLRKAATRVHADSKPSNRHLSLLLYVWRDGAWEVYDPP